MTKTLYVLLAALTLAPQAAAAAARPVRVAAVESRTIAPTLPVSGAIHSKNEQQITAATEGQILAVTEPGTRVRRGQVVAKLDATALQLQLKEQQAQVARARAQLRFLEVQLERQKQLRRENHITDVDLEQAQLDRAVAKSDLSIAETRVRQTKDRLRRATIRAQFDGVVVERLRRAGEDVARGTTLARIADLDSLEVRALVPVKYGARPEPRVRLSVFGFESRFEGQTRSIVPSVNPRSQTFEVRVDLPPDAYRAWTIGQLVTVAVPIAPGAEGPSVLAVPRDALVLRQEGAYVFRIRTDNTAERVAVRVGDGEREWVAVKGALEVGDRVAIRGAETLKDGQEVAIVEAMRRPDADKRAL